MMRELALKRRGFLRGSITLAGASIVLPTFASLGSCAPSPAVFAPVEPLVSAIADRVIPETSTPGALAAGVPAYIAAIFEQHLTADQQHEIIAGLDAIEAFASEQVGIGFAEAESDAQDQILDTLSKGQGSEAAASAWRELRNMIVFGFYTSEAATEELPYEHIPGRYDGCVPLAEVGGAWLERGV